MSVIKLTSKNYEEEVMQSKKPVLIDFWAAWCGPCKMMSPVIDQIAQENEDIKVCKVNIDEEKELAEQFQIMSIPTIVAIKSAKIVNTSVGVAPKEEIINMLK